MATNSGTTVPGADARSSAVAVVARAHRIPSDFLCKQVMAWTGSVFAAYVLVHMVGNLKAYLGPEEFDGYALWLRRIFEPLAPYSSVLWFIRAVMSTCLIGHVSCAYVLWRRARRARGPFARKSLPLRTFTARTMPVTGIVLLGFIIFHLLDLTTGTRPIGSAQWAPTTATRSPAYDNLVHSFERPWVSAVYVLTMLVLGAHLSHGLWLAANDFGVTGLRLRRGAQAAAAAIAIAVVVGNISLPIAVLTGVLS